MPNKKTLLLCWDFPPNDGIGGRRWAKMSKWLLKSGHEIHVIKSKSKVGNQNSAWLSDVESDQIHIYEVNTYLPVKWLNSKENKFSDKLKYKFAAIYLTFFSKGTIYDKAIGKERDVLKLASKIIELNKIENVIVTGAPFNLMYYAAKIKLVFDRDSRKILGGQIISNIDLTQYMNTLSVVIQNEMTVEELAMTDFFFQPHFNKPWSLLNTVALKAL